MASSFLASSFRRGLALALVWTIGAPAAIAQGPTDGRAAAEVLFRDGRAALERGDLPEACPKLAESYRLDPATGALLALALCYERAGKIASAWSAYLEAEGRAKREGQEQREVAARERVQALAPRLSYLTIVASPEARRAPGFSVERGGVAIGEALLGSRVPIDPGSHEVVMKVAGAPPDVRRFELAEGESKELVFEARAATAPAPTPAPTPAPPTPAPATGPSGLMVAGLVIGGVGVVGLGVGSALGLVASGQDGDSEARCAPFEDGDPTTGTAAEHAACTDLRNDALATGDVATVAFLAGAGLAAVGLTLVLVGAQGDSTASARATLELAPAPLGLSLRGRL